MERWDTVVVGAGIVGLATARALVERHQAVLVIETEDRIALHQTGRNSGVIHSGLYYKPGSLKATMAREGATALYAYCRERSIPHERCGKLVVAVTNDEIPALDELERRGRANGLEGVERLDGSGIREREPDVAGIAGLRIAETGIVDYTAVAEAFASDVLEGGDVRTGTRFLAARREPDSGFVIETTSGEVNTKTLVNCAGLQSDRVAEKCGVNSPVRIIPFRGEYRHLTGRSAGLVKHMVYPVPDPRLPFLGVHVTRHIDGSRSAGPNAILAWHREGYEQRSFHVGDAARTLTWPGFWRLARRHARRGAEEWTRARSRRAFASAARRLVPEIDPAELVPAGSGIRAQAVSRDGSLVDDFRIVEDAGQIHVLNAPSPAATASIAIGRTVAERTLAHL